MAGCRYRAGGRGDARRRGARRPNGEAGDVPLGIPDLAAFLAGDWRLERRIADRRAGVTGRLAGAARFTPAPGGLRYVESGTLIFDGFRGEASQSYGFALNTAGMADVMFKDGRPFHTLDLRSGRAEIFHTCAPDAYRGRYRVGGWDSWNLVWVVAGPRKDLRIASHYRRA